jgi:hypothetical protein
VHAPEDGPVGSAAVDRPADGPALDRRHALGVLGAGLAATVLSSCTPGGKPEPLPPVREPTPGVDPDVVVAGDTLAAEREMLEAIDATMARHQGLQPLLAPVAAVHQAHVDLLTRAVPGSSTSPSANPSASPSAGPSFLASPSAAPPGSPAGASPSGSPSGSASPSTSGVPRDPDRALRRLARHEDRLSLFDKQQAFTARSGAFARLLASMAAAAAQQAMGLGHRPNGTGGSR